MTHSRIGVVSFVLALVPVAMFPLSLASGRFTTFVMGLFIAAFALAPAAAIILAIIALPIRRTRRLAFPILGLILGILALPLGISWLWALWDDYQVVGIRGW
jgi:hypothetical protein